MNASELMSQVALGEDSTRQFKVDFSNSNSLAAEMVAFANAEGGNIFIGVADNGTVPGLAPKDVGRLNQLIGNVASQHVRSPLSVQTENVKALNGKLVIVLTIPEGLNKPYFAKNGVIWIKKGSDKRKITSKEEMLRLFQSTGEFCGDEEESKASIDKIDKLRFRDFLKEKYN